MDNTQVAVKARYEKAKALMASGTPKYKALEEVGMGGVTYAKQEKAEKGTPTPEKKKYKTKPKQPKFIDLSPPGTPGPALVSIVVCSLDNVKEVLGRLK